MAETANEDAPDNEEGATPEGEAAPAGGSKKKLILFGAIGLVALTVLGGGGYFFFLRGTPDEAAAQKALAKRPVGFLDMREMTVNLAPDSAQDRTRLLKFKVSLEVKDPKLIPDIQPLMPRVEDTFQVFLRELRASDLEGSGGLYRLREELLRRINYAVYPAKVDAVLFKDMVVQ
jgi:flagellar FliL protein